MTPVLKTLCAAALFTVWGALVYTGHAPIDQYVSAIRDALIALGVFQATLANPKG